MSDKQSSHRENWMALRPITLRMANDFVASHHRHNGRTNRDGGKFAIGAQCGTILIGVAIVGHPLSATLMDGYTAEVLRLCVLEHAPKNTCSMLYAASWQAWKAMGGLKLVTYTLRTEPGASLRGAGWILADPHISPSVWHRPRQGRNRRGQLVYRCEKQRWEISAPQKHRSIDADAVITMAESHMQAKQHQVCMDFS